MHWPFMFLLVAVALVVPHRLARAQVAQDTLAERVGRPSVRRDRSL